MSMLIPVPVLAALAGVTLALPPVLIESLSFVSPPCPFELLASACIVVSNVPGRSRRKNFDPFSRPVPLPLGLPPVFVSCQGLWS